MSIVECASLYHEEYMSCDFMYRVDVVPKDVNVVAMINGKCGIHDTTTMTGGDSNLTSTAMTHGSFVDRGLVDRGLVAPRGMPQRWQAEVRKDNIPSFC